jgi:hypothetical protein
VAVFVGDPCSRVLAHVVIRRTIARPLLWFSTEGSKKGNQEFNERPEREDARKIRSFPVAL